MAKNLNQANEAVLEELERTKWKRTFQTIIRDWRLYTLLIPMLIFLLLYKYLPIEGILLGFKWNTTTRADEWCGLNYARMIIDGPLATTFWQSFRNTFVNSMYGLIFGFPIPIFIALLFSEIKNAGYRSFLQVCSYLPHFISTVVVTSIIGLWCFQGLSGITGPGMLHVLFSNLGLLEPGSSILDTPRYFRPLYQISGVWEGAGYGSIVYFAAIMAISPTNYEAARIDGASKMQQIRYVTFPGMAPTLTIMLIMRIGSILNIGYEKVILMIGDHPSSFTTGEVISSFVYRYSGRDGSASGVSNLQQIGIIADLFNAIIAMCLVLGANAISRRVSNTSLF